MLYIVCQSSVHLAFTIAQPLTGSLAQVRELTVMTLNVRQPDQDDGANNWRDLLIGVVREAVPDLIGTQELFTLQAEYILANLPGYAWIGTGRFGDSRDKHVGIFYRRDRLRPLTCGDFWLSEAPETPGSSSWDIIRPRQVTWGHFEMSNGQSFHHFNTHFPYRKVEQEARRRTAALLQTRAGELNPVVLTGDFNSPTDGEIYRKMAETFQDAWLTAKQRSGPEGTLNGFGRTSEPRRIDWILYRAPWKVCAAETIATTVDGIYPSDHFPVTARFDVSC